MKPLCGRFEEKNHIVSDFLHRFRHWLVIDFDGDRHHGGGDMLHLTRSKD